MELSRSRALQAFEWIGAGVLSVAALILHFRTFLNAGPLWRDEISSLKLATMPTLRSAWATLVFDPAPAGFFGLLRFWTKLGFGNTDLQLRILGFLIGCAGLLAIWFCARKTNRDAPLWPLALFALNPIAIQYGDSLRGYGLGVFFVLIAFAGIYRITMGGGRNSIVLAALGSIGAVQSVFTNAILVFALCAAASAVLARTGAWRRVAIVTAVGVCAAITLLPYLPIFRQTREWSMLVATSPDYLPLLSIYAHTLGEIHFIGTWVTAICALVVVVLGVFAFLRRRPFANNSELSDQLVFSAIALIIASLGTLAFFWNVGWPTSVWYYLPLAALTAMCIHLAAGSISLTSVRVQSLFRSVPVVLALALFPLTFARSAMRITNADFMANTVARAATADDLIVVNPYFYAVSFQRYYTGHAPWVTIPAIADCTLHRWDLLKSAITTSRPEREALDRMEQTLRAGHKVFLIGSFPRTNGRAPELLPPAPTSRYGWMLGAYISSWSLETSYLLETHVTSGGLLFADDKKAINELERLQTLVVSGWRENSIAQSP